MAMIILIFDVIHFASLFSAYYEYMISIKK